MKIGTIAVVCAAAVAMGLAAGCGQSKSAGKSQVVALVDKAVALVERDGEKAFAEFRKKDSEWFRGDVYVFVDDMEGRNLCHPVNSDLEGKGLLDMKDANGNEFVREMIELLKTRDSGWVEYAWTKPGASAPSKKLGYVKKAKCGDKMILVGSGFYVD